MNIPDPKFRPGDRVQLASEPDVAYTVDTASTYYPNIKTWSYMLSRKMENGTKAIHGVNEYALTLVPAKPRFAVGQVVAAFDRYFRICSYDKWDDTFVYVDPAGNCYYECNIRALKDAEIGPRS